MDDLDAPELWQSTSALSSTESLTLAAEAGIQPSNCNIQ